MLSCGLASAPAIAALLHHGAVPLLVDEVVLGEAVEWLAMAGGPRTTPSGAAGLAGLLHASRDAETWVRLKLDIRSRILIVITEGV
jgi:diaminopropionate ammonia-lyase